jgi:hypothetical protein
MPFWAKPLAADVKEKRLPAPSERYRNIKAVVNTGFNAKKLKEILAEQNLNARYHKEENFRRIKAKNLHLTLTKNRCRCGECSVQ